MTAILDFSKWLPENAYLSISLLLNKIDGDMHALTDSVNRFFHGVAADLIRPLDDSSLPPPPPPDAVPDEVEPRESAQGAWA